jgi:uncharacterized protein
MKPSILFAFLCALATEGTQAQIIIQTPQTTGIVAGRSWKALRDDRVVKQDTDYSCGAASVATILHEFYGKALTEADVLKLLPEQDFEELFKAKKVPSYSFADLQAIMPQLGMKALGLAVSYEQLAKLKIPVVVHFPDIRGQGHFSVLRGISDTHVRLGDPSWGNRLMSKDQFLEIWDVANKGDAPDKDAQAKEVPSKGRILLLTPDGAEHIVATDSSFFTPPPAVFALPRLMMLPPNRY